MPDTVTVRFSYRQQATQAWLAAAEVPAAIAAEGTDAILAHLAQGDWKDEDMQHVSYGDVIPGSFEIQEEEQPDSNQQPGTVLGTDNLYFVSAPDEVLTAAAQSDSAAFELSQDSRYSRKITLFAAHDRGLDPAVAREILHDLFDTLYMEDDGSYNLDKSWDSAADILEGLAARLHAAGLRPCTSHLQGSST